MASLELGDSLADIRTILASWGRHLRARNRSPRTIQSYEEAVLQFARFLLGKGLPTAVDEIEGRHIEEWLGVLLDRHRPATAANRYRSLKQFFRWLEEEDEIPASPMAKMSPPRIPEESVAVIGDEALSALLQACAGKDLRSPQRHRHNPGIPGHRRTRFEIAGLKPEDVDYTHDVVLVLGKGARPRACPFGRKTAIALDRYLRARARDLHASEPWLRLGPKGRFTASGIRQMLQRRCRQAGIPECHPLARSLNASSLRSLSRG